MYRIAVILILFATLTGCITKHTAVPDGQVARLHISEVPSLLTARAVAPPMGFTNGVISATWENGDPEESTLVNWTTGATFDAGTNGAITVGGLRVGQPQLFSVTNTIGTSNTQLVTPQSDTNTMKLVLAFQWRGKAGIVQASPNQVLWTNVGPIAANGIYIATNMGPFLFFRVMTTP